MNKIIKIVGVSLVSFIAMFSNADIATCDILTFTNANDVQSFAVQDGKYAKVRMVVVGGGGAGGTVGQDVVTGAGGGGGAGGFIDRISILKPGTYYATIGKGGKKAETYASSWVGDDGEYSYISFNSLTNYIAAAKGGGGGGSVKKGGQGTPGASGGGGSWYGTFLQGGSGTDGYGWAGGTPTNTLYGAGGGGAKSTGSSDGTPGDGASIEVAGKNIVLARGGRGGDRGEVGYEPKDGESFGNGGDGAVNGLGGSGADGAIFIEVLNVFEYKIVEIPDYTKTFVWTNGIECVAYDFTDVEGIDSIVGTNKVTCGEDNAGVGRYKFTVYLKEEYMWSDGTTDPKTFSWRINDQSTVGNISVEVTKTVDWVEGTNATISITIHSTPEKKKTTPNVLFIGSLCGAHGFSSDVLNAALNAITKVGNVDYYFFNRTFNLNSSSDSVYNEDDQAYFSGSMTVGETRSGTVYALNPNNDNSRVALENTSGNHGTMNGFYRQLYTVITNGTSSKYDYIIFSFDRSRLAERFEKVFDYESEVVDYLKPFYENNSVIWLVDEQGDDKEPANSAFVQTPWFPSQLTQYNGSYWETLDSGVSYWKGSSTIMNGWVNDGLYAYYQYNALVGLMCPSYYPISKESYKSNVLPDQNGSTSWSDDTVLKVRNTACFGIDNQVVYNNASNVASVIEKVIKATVATLDVSDNIYVKNGLKFDSNTTTGYWTTNSAYASDSTDVATNRWTEYTTSQLTFSDEDGLKISLPGVQSELWSILKIGVVDTGKFLSSIDATYNEKTGKWEKDPNNGPVEVEMKSTSDSVLAEDNASTTVAWSFEAYKITGANIHGEGEFVINGFYTNMISVAKGYNPEVLFKAAPGWALDYLEVDGQRIENYEYMTNWFFSAIQADHDIKVGFTNIVVNPPPPEVGPVTNVYDGAGYSIETIKDPTFAEGYEEYSNMWYMVYSLDPDASPTNRSAWTTEGVVTNVGTTTVYARICLMQPGYEDGAIVPYWCGTNTVTILPREVTIQYDDYVQTSTTRNSDTFKYNLVDGEIVEGDYFTIESGSKGSGLCTNFPDKGSKTVDSIGISSGLTIKTPGFDGCNYIINVIPGTYYYPDIELVAIAPDVVVYYDGNSHYTTATVTYPSNPTTSETIGEYSNWSNSSSGQSGYGRPGQDSSNKQQRSRTISSSIFSLLYSTDNITFTEDYPTFINVGTNTVYYKVNYSTYSFTEIETRTKSGGNQGRNPGGDSYTYSYTTNNIQNIVYDEYLGSAKVIILPLEATITAGSASKTYDGNPLVDPSYTAIGFISGEGVDSAAMTSSSTITNVGSTSNVVDQAKTVLKSNTLASNYIIKYVNGTLEVIDIPGGGGSDGYIDESVKPWIIDHDNGGNGYVYLAFNPRYQTANNIPFNVWLERTAANNGFKMKYGRTRAECDVCDPVTVELSKLEKHISEMSFDKVWVKVPVSNIVNIASMTVELAKPTGYVRVFVAAVANSQDPLEAEGVDSTNVFGIFKAESKTSKTMIAVPWTWYSEYEKDAEDIPSRKLIKNENLSENDIIYCSLSNGTTYASWVLDSGDFTPCSTIYVDKNGLGSIKVVADDEDEDYTNATRIARGNSLWLVRQNPVVIGDNSTNSIPFWIYGQSVETNASNVIVAPTGDEKVASTPLGNPFLADVKLNNLQITNLDGTKATPSTSDRIWFYTAEGNIKDIMYISNKGWRMATTMMVSGRVRTVYTYDITIPAGLGFWYDRRGTTDLKITWPTPVQYNK